MSASLAHNRSVSRNERPGTLNPGSKSIQLSNVRDQLLSFSFGCYTNPDNPLHRLWADAQRS